MIICLGTTPTVQRTMAFTELRVDSVNRASHVHEFASGKSINAARVLHTLGEPCTATGFVGGDSGRFIRADLDAAGMTHDFIEVNPPTRLCITVIDESHQTATELIEEARPVTRDDRDRLFDKLGNLLQSANALVLSGTVAPGAGVRFYADCIERAGTNLPVILDAAAEPLAWALEAKPMIVKINRNELAQSLDADVDDDDAARGAMRQMIVRGARWIIVTAGQAPTLISDGRAFWRIQTPVVEVISPIGSGDALAAGLAAGIARGMDVPRACALGVACAAANAQTAHAGHIHRETVEQLVRQIQVEPVVRL